MNVLNPTNKEINKPIVLIMYRLVDRSSLSCVSRNFPVRHSVQTGHGTQLFPYPVDTEGFITWRKKRQESGADISSPSTECNNAWSYTSTAKYLLRCLSVAYGKGINFHWGFKNDIGVYRLAHSKLLSA
jgi:hypothetical protein